MKNLWVAADSKSASLLPSSQSASSLCSLSICWFENPQLIYLVLFLRNFAMEAIYLQKEADIGAADSTNNETLSNPEQIVVPTEELKLWEDISKTVKV